jgi:hypothetical protein
MDFGCGGFASIEALPYLVHTNDDDPGRRDETMMTTVIDDDE